MFLTSLNPAMFRTVWSIQVFFCGQAYLFEKGGISLKIWRHHKPEVVSSIFQLRKVLSSWVPLDTLTISQSEHLSGRWGGRGATRLFLGKHMCLWKNTLIQWFHSWKSISLYEWHTMKNLAFCTILFQVFIKSITFFTFCRFWYPNWVIWLTRPSPKKVPFHPDFGCTCLPTQVRSTTPSLGQNSRLTW